MSFTVKFTLGFTNKMTQGPETEGMSPVIRLQEVGEVTIGSFTLPWFYSQRKRF